MNAAKLKILLIILILLFQSPQSGAALVQPGNVLKYSDWLNKGEYVIIENYNVMFVQMNKEGTFAQISVFTEKGDKYDMVLFETDTQMFQSIDVEMVRISPSSDSVHISVYAPESYIFRGKYGGPGEGLKDIPVIQLIKTLSATKVNVGEDIAVHIEVKNIGTGKAMSLSVTDPDLPYFTFISGTRTYSGELNPNGFIPLDYMIRATKPGNYSMLGTTATYKNASGYLLSNASPAFRIEVLGNVTPPPVKKAIVDVKISLDKREVVEGDELIVKIEATNIGNATAKNIRFEGIVPDGLQISKDIDYFIPVLEERNVKKYESVLKAVRPGTYNVKINTIHDGGSENFTSDLVLVREGPFAFLLKLPAYFYILPAAFVAIATGWIFWRHKQYKY